MKCVSIITVVRLLVFFLLYDQVFPLRPIKRVITSIGLQIHNHEVLESLQFDEKQLQIDLLLNTDSATTSQHEIIITETIVLGSKICFTIDARICHCFPESIASIASTLYFPISCVIAANASLLSSPSYYFGAQITLPPFNQLFVDLPANGIYSIVTSAQKVTPTLNSPARVPVWPLPSPSSLTLVLALIAADLPRAFILLSSLSQIPAECPVYEMLLFTPENDEAQIRNALHHLNLSFPIRVVSEVQLLGRLPSPFRLVYSGIQMPHATLTPAHAHYYTYGIQMAIKLLAARMVKTDFYVTLDADVVLLQHEALERVVVDGKAVYEDESRDVHRFWWRGSAEILGLVDGGSLEENLGEGGDGFSVTPAVLSTYGSLVTLSQLEDRFQQPQLPKEESSDSVWIAAWLQSLGALVVSAVDSADRRVVVWSEYTLYRLALSSVGLFSLLHVPEGSADSLVPPLRLHCYDVWFPQDLPWKHEEIWNLKKQNMLQCIFSVVQSSSNAEVDLVHSQVMHILSH